VNYAAFYIDEAERNWHCPDIDMKGKNREIMPVERVLKPKFIER
jgi:hypothetical protein